MSDPFQFTDRYDALGIPRPDPETMCKGQCEGVGWYPVWNDTGGMLRLLEAEITPEEYDQWHVAHAKSCGRFGRVRKFLRGHWREAFRKCDGWHFIKCSGCNGTGKRVAP